MRELLPLISAPSAAFVISTYLFISYADICQDTGERLALLALIAVISGPIYNMLFHSTWMLVTSAYQGFGYQSELLKKAQIGKDKWDLQTRESIRKQVEMDFDKKIINKANTEKVEYARKLISGYITQLHFRWSVAVSAIFLLVTNWRLGWDFILTTSVVSIAVFVISYWSGHRTNNELTEIERGLG